MAKMSWRQATLAAFGPTKPKARRYWQGAFPELMEFRPSDADLEAQVLLTRKIAKYAFIRIERARTLADYERLDAIANTINRQRKVEPRRRVP